MEKYAGLFSVFQNICLTLTYFFLNNSIYSMLSLVEQLFLKMCKVPESGTGYGVYVSSANSVTSFIKPMLFYLFWMSFEMHRA